MDICSLLVPYGCHIHGDSIPPLQYAVYCNSPSVVAVLLSARLKFPDTVSRALAALENASGCAPLHTAVWFDHLECARLLIDAGADVNAWSEDMHTPLELAVMTHNTDAVQLLLQSPNCQVDKLGSQHATALQHAVARGSVVIMNWFFTYNYTVLSVLKII